MWLLPFIACAWLSAEDRRAFYDHDGDQVTAELDCNDEDPTVLSGEWWYPDVDGDGFGGDDRAEQACVRPDGWLAEGGDCDDNDPERHPGASWYADGDGDGFGSGTALATCEAPAGYVQSSSDCDDLDPGVHPGASEVCATRSVDDDCDGLIDAQDGLVEDAVRWWADDDDDGYGDALQTGTVCAGDDGFVDNAADCDDADSKRHPGADERCDGKDENCSGNESDATDQVVLRPDLDADGYGDAGAGVLACPGAPGLLARGGDCDDGAFSVNPSAPDVCDGVDQNCSGSEGDATGQVVLRPDADGDGFGDRTTGVLACPGSAGLVLQSGDCADDDDAVNPDAIETCDGTDSNCDGSEDDALDADVYFADDDDDGFGDAKAALSACAPRAGLSEDATDCDDRDHRVFTGAIETCDGIDTNCSGTELDAVDAKVWFTDVDADGFGAGASTKGCTAPSGTAGAGGDCDDDDSRAYPGATEVCDGAVDEDCDGVDDFTDCGCDDGILSSAADETHVDCGGGLCDVCDVGQQCDLGSDCASGACVSGTCRVWSRRLAINENEGGGDLAIAANGDVFVGVNAEEDASLGGPMLFSLQHNPEILIARYAPDGTHRWSKRFGTWCWDESVDDVAADAFNNTYIVGTYVSDCALSFGGPALLQDGTGLNAYVAAFDADGKSLWATGLGGPNSGAALAVAVSDSTVYVGGVDRSRGASLEDAAVWAINRTTGVQQWKRVFVGPSDQWVRELAVTPSGQVVIGGTYGPGNGAVGGLPLAGAGGIDAFMATLDGQTGAPAWAVSLRGSTDDHLAGLAIDAADNVYASGWIDNSVTTFTVADGPVIDPLSSWSDVWVAKLTASGAHAWSSVYGGPGSEGAGSLALAPDGAVVVSGFTQGVVSVGGPPLEAGSGWDPYVAAYDPTTGVLVDQAQWPEHGYTEPYDLDVDPNTGNVVISGVTDADEIDLGNGPLSEPFGGDSLWFASLGRRPLQSTFPLDGASRERAAPSCAAILDRYPDMATVQGGTFWVDTTTPGDTTDAWRVYCRFDMDGGGWTRVAYYVGGASAPYVCSLTNARGTADQVATASASSWWSASAVSQYPTQTDDVLVADSSTNWVVFRSSAPGWTWQAIADGTVNSQNVDVYGVSGVRWNGTTLASGLVGTAWCPTNKPCLLGGYLSGGNTPFLGGGAYANTSGAFVQDAACTQNGATGFYGGSTVPTWATGGSVYVR